MMNLKMCRILDGTSQLFAAVTKEAKANLYPSRYVPHRHQHQSKNVQSPERLNIKPAL